MSGAGSILKVRIITRFKLFGLEQTFEEEVGVDGDLVVAMLGDGARHAAGGYDVGLAVKGRAYLVDKTINHGGGAVNNAALHAL